MSYISAWNIDICLMQKKGRILVVDDNAGIRSSLKILLQMHFAAVELIPSPNGLPGMMDTFRPDAVLLDMNFHRDINTGNEGLYWLSEIKHSYPDVEVVLFTAYADVALAVEGMKRGAFDFVVKPWDNARMLEILSEACSGRLAGKSGRSRKAEPEPVREMYWGEGDDMLQLRRTVGKIAPTDASVLITGENGTGKDVLAWEIHRLSGRRTGPFVSVDLGSLTESIFESELFGHVKGAFTDAKSDHPGKFEQADGGTLFLDEIGNIPVHLQSKLLRVLQTRSVTRVGDTRQIPVDIRLVCATNADIPAMVRMGDFREDLYYRINTIQLHIPPLRNRQDEIIPLAGLFLRRFSEKYRRKVCGLAPGAEKALLSYRWSGNIRELQNCIEKAVILSDNSLLTAGDLMLPPLREDVQPGDLPDGDETLEMVEERAVRAAVRKYNGNLSLVAKALDISRPTLYSKLKKYGI